MGNAVVRVVTATPENRAETTHSRHIAQVSQLGTIQQSRAGVLKALELRQSHRPCNYHETANCYTNFGVVRCCPLLWLASMKAKPPLPIVSHPVDAQNHAGLTQLGVALLQVAVDQGDTGRAILMFQEALAIETMPANGPFKLHRAATLDNLRESQLLPTRHKGLLSPRALPDSRWNLTQCIFAVGRGGYSLQITTRRNYNTFKPQRPSDVRSLEMQATGLQRCIVTWGSTIKNGLKRSSRKQGRIDLPPTQRRRGCCIL